MVKLNSGGKVEGEGQHDQKLSLRDLRAGAMRSSATYAALMVELEHGRYDKIRVLSTVLNALGISLEEIECYRREPSDGDEAARDRWEHEMDILESRAPPPLIE
jgi:uroporphyrinogen-III synthase